MLSMDDTRLTKQIFLWDRDLNRRNIVTSWSGEVRGVFQISNAIDTYDSSSLFDIKLFVADMRKSLTSLQNDYLQAECSEKPKLRTFMLFKEFQVSPAYIYKPLSFFHRRMMAKLRLGCLPIRVETARYSIPRLPESERYCLVCKNHETMLDTSDLGSIENEAHFLFQCRSFLNEREIWFSNMSLPANFESLSFQEKFKTVLNIPENIKPTAIFIFNAYNQRSKILK